MNKKEFLKIFNGSQFISGIHNYCDRWCERCSYSEKCSVYTMDTKVQKGKSSEEEKEAVKNSMEKTNESLLIALEMFEEIAKESGIDLEALRINEEAEKQKELEAIEHPIAINSKKYSYMAYEWTQKNAALFYKFGEELLEKENLGIYKKQDTINLLEINEALSIIQWDYHQIHIKLMRALKNREVNWEFEDEIQNDANGSAKVALISVERSLKSWETLLELFNERENEVLEILAVLDRTRKDILKEFPKVRQFVRPGFDE
ncbi:hypothetical protein HX109_14460 [Galbibacter sp. BG1]|uniref:hypothetical protein n=1 Tax=Galbibacter sp. BG1 TaxID=1170699 RepID=UPI0015BD80DD|nr:hypothetical protein [Galbibacter sp. BG1]QLE02703.1 hypothetical protein HX109_14460 [Galbibacter sp. BG1]